MKITLNPQIIIKNNYAKPNNKSTQNNSNNATNPNNNIQELPSHSYLDFNISFSGRTPENFYEQDFNRENMPDTMKEYLNYDYETRQHIPPEQMMNEVFKYIDIADDFEDVKSIYPNEKLFKTLHENVQNNRTSVLAEIKLAKEMSDEPLFKDDSDNFGMYLLKKIYLEGKTIKEINNDFYKKDMNDSYKGIISKDIDRDTTAAYGIMFPKQAFWHSFIATREEYKKFFVTLPKNSTNPSVNSEVIENKTSEKSTTKTSNDTTVNQPQKRTRKYKIKDYHKKQIADDIKDSKGDTKEIERKIRKRFANDDPQASFILKYLSPIMTVAADRVHLSEEMKAFCENEKENGKIGDDEFMFKRFWKANPLVLKDYSLTIPDTIDYFEDVYGEGGLIPINKDLEVIKPDTLNTHEVDRVTPEFLELLNYTQTIMPEREKRYAQHDKLQQDWEEHFINRYGLPGEETATEEIAQIDNPDKIEKVETPTEPINTDKLFKKCLKEEVQVYPDDYAQKYITDMLKNKDIDDDYKLAYAYYICDKDVKDVKMSLDEFNHKFNEIEDTFVSKFGEDSFTAKLSMIKVLNDNNYRDISLYTGNIYNMPNVKETREQFRKIFNENKKELNRIYANAHIKPDAAKTKEITQELYKQLLRYKITSDKTENNSSQILLMLQDACSSPIRAKMIQRLLEYMVKNNYAYTKFILEPNDSEDEKRAKFENIMIVPLLDMAVLHDNPILPLTIGESNLKKYMSFITDIEVKTGIVRNISGMNPKERQAFTATNDDELNTIPEFITLGKRKPNISR